MSCPLPVFPFVWSGLTGHEQLLKEEVQRGAQEPKSLFRCLCGQEICMGLAGEMPEEL